MGHHYSGAVLGPAFGSKSLGMLTGIVSAGFFVVLGALLSPVVSTYVSLASLRDVSALAVLTSFVGMTNLTTYLKVPTSTIQLYAFAVLGAALAGGVPVNFQLLGLLAASWVIAPITSYFLGRGMFKVIPRGRFLRAVIIGVTMYSALVLGLNDVSNAAATLITSGLNAELARGFCGFSMFVGMLMWGPRLVKRVGVELIDMDYPKAAAAQLTKSIIISAMNAVGMNASMNQTIISALASMGARKKVLRSILKGWIYSPIIGFLAAYVLTLILLHG
jgi:PiT family inorganic phosphate transporter